MNLKNCRIEKSCTQKQIADAINVSRQVYANYETGVNQPAPDILIKLADFFGCTIDYLVGRESEDGSVVVSPELSPTEAKLLADFQSLNFQAQARVLGYIEALLSAPKITKKQA